MTDTSWLGPPIDVRPLFPRQQAAFTALLCGLAPAGWERPTACPGWDVKDIAAAALRIVSIIWSPPGLPDAD